MNIEYLKYFAELAKLQHYGKAAKALNISQPGLSHAIKTLEDEYGVPLFQKEGRNVSLSRYEIPNRPLPRPCAREPPVSAGPTPATGTAIPCAPWS